MGGAGRAATGGGLPREPHYPIQVQGPKKRGPLAKKAPPGGRGPGTWHVGLARVEPGYGFSGKSRACVILNA